ncbi:MAG: hypothetical protein ABFS10_12115 [Bacteroidota bacterium]
MKSIKQIIALVILILGLQDIQGQNRLDDQGRKSGPWRVEYPNGNPRYEATFREGRPVGIMVRYYESGEVRVRMVFGSVQEDRSAAEMFYKSGKRAAGGIYLNRLKDSVWTYYSEYDGTVRLRENYLEGKLHGEATRLYPDGVVSEEIMWREDSREGPWMQYFEDGSIRLKGHYENNMLNGPYEVYFSNNTLMMSGIYLDNQSADTWSYYDDSGNLLYTLEYENGRPVDQEKYLQLMQDTLLRNDSIETPQPFQPF